MKVKSEDEITDKQLEDLKQKLLSSRDKFILSNNDTLPESVTQQKKPGLIKQTSSMIAGPTGARDHQGGGMGRPVLTSQSEKRNLAIKQISETFERSKTIKVGAQKVDQRGRAIKGVTATAVKDILPMHQAELLKLSMVVNDDDLEKAVMESANVNNGHLLHSFKDKSGDMR